MEALLAKEASHTKTTRDLSNEVLVFSPNISDPFSFCIINLLADCPDLQC